MGNNNSIQAPPQQIFKAEQSFNSRLFKPRNNGSVYTPETITSTELQGTDWKKNAYSVPVYVALAGVGVSLTSRYSIGPDGIFYYAIDKVNPLEPQRDQVVSTYYKIPQVYKLPNGRTKQLIWPLQYAITEYWPNAPKDQQVKIINNTNNFFYISIDELKEADDPGILAAIGAFKNDYPNVLDNKFRTQIDAPDNIIGGTSGRTGIDPAPKKYTTLHGGENAERLRQALYFQATGCPDQKPEPISPTVVNIPIPKCGKSKTGFDDVSQFQTVTAENAPSSRSAQSSKIATDINARKKLVTDIDVHDY